MNNYGFLKPKIEKEHYVLGQGNVPFQILQPLGDWSDSLPEGEAQSIPSFDTYNCTGFNSSNQIEQYMFKAFDIKANYSDRWIGIIAGTDPAKGGNDPHTVYEAIRKNGLIPEEILPFSSDITTAEEYFSFKGANREACYIEGRKWLSQYDFKHEWVFTTEQPLDEKINNIKVALKYSPLAISVFAWVKDARDIYISLGEPNHWTSMYAQKDFSNIFDSYFPWTKVVEQNIMYCKRISISKKKISISPWKRFWDWFMREKLIYRAFKIFNINLNNAKNKLS